MWHEGSHSSSEQSWNGGRESRIMIPLGGGFIQIFVMRVFNLTFQGGNQLYIEILTLRTIVCFGKV